jgi:diguanylate cyclase (GGDEF)-like protein
MQDSFDNQSVPPAGRRQQDEVQPGFKPASFDKLRNMRILIVDDLPTNIILMQAILEHGGFRHQLTANTGDKAIEILEKHTRAGHCDIDLVLLDIILPDQNGYTICRRMQNHPQWQTIPVIMVTSEAKWREETAQASYESGATEILFKPVRSNELLPRVIACLQLKSERDQRIRQEKHLQQRLSENALLETRLSYLVSHDDLTGLFNRRRLEQVIELGIVYARYYQRSSALLLIDIDDFSRINELAGYSSGDQVLCHIARMLRSYSSDNNLVARIGTDEFAVFLDKTDTTLAQDTAESIHRALSDLNIDHVDINKLTASIGITLITNNDTRRCSEIIAHAEQACKQAKTRGGSQSRLFSKHDPSMPAVQQQDYWQPRLQEALDNDTFEYQLQPVITAGTHAVMAQEMLLRIRDKGRLCTPSSFLAAAENTGLMNEIDDQVIRHAASLLAEHPAYFNDKRLHINLSPLALLEQRSYKLLSRLLEERPFMISRLGVKLNESILRDNHEPVAEAITALAETGCQVIIDNFGADLNTCKTIEELPIRMLKIDSCFIQNLSNDSMDQTLVRSIIDIAHTLGRSVIAGQVDVQASLTMLESFGIDFMQGELCGGPRSIEELLPSS